MSNHAPYTTTAVAVAALGGAYCAYRAYQQYQRTRIPDTWTRVGTLKDLWVYPVKSCRAVSVDKIECSHIGLKSGWLRDRVLMVVDDSYHFITARVCPELYSIQPAVKNEVLTLTSPEFGSIDVNLAEVIAANISNKSKVWGVEVPIYDCGEEVSKWLSKIISRPDKTFRLAYYASQYGRGAPTEGVGKVYNITKKDTGAFTDDTSYNLIVEASVEELNSRLSDVDITPMHFRPNFVVSGPRAYDEDNWKFVKIGENIFEVVLPCVRCAITTINPETGAREAKSEPLSTLRSYRLVTEEKYRKAVGVSPRMGLQLALRSGPGGVINKDAEVYVA